MNRAASEDPDALYRDVWPRYFEVQRRDRWFYEQLWRVLLRQLERRASDRGLIEFGSGPGFLLALAERRGWDVVGIEPSALARANADQLGVWTRSHSHDLARYPCAIATEVLEHVADPLETLSEWGRALIPGGYLALSVPNDNNPLQRFFGRWISPDRKTARCWIHPTHKSYFTPKSLKALLEKAGFEIVWQRTSFPVELLLAIPMLPRPWAWKLSRLWPAPPLLWRLDVGRHVLMIGRKACR